ncbi:MAG TPA: DUF2950 domain-containing protein [Casimicrobiaceae bacterium]
MTDVTGKNLTRFARGLRSASLLVSLLVCAACFSATAGAMSAQRTFASADEAASALAKAVNAHDRPTVLAILGPGADKWIGSGDPVADRAAAEHFAAAYEQKHAIAPEGDSRATLTIGADDWPFAFPIVKAGNAWHFDTEAGKTEMLARRIGGNELAAINVLLAITDAQHDYASQDHNRDGVREYARKFASTSGKHDGLYWPTKAGEPPSPLGPLVTRATSEGYSKGGSAYHGYYFRPLIGQTSNAKGGAQDYVVKGHMIGGFGAIAYPAIYGSSGVMTLMVNQDGVVYQKDLGPDTAAKASAIKRFDPGPGWAAVSTK